MNFIFSFEFAFFYFPILILASVSLWPAWPARLRAFSKAAFFSALALALACLGGLALTLAMDPPTGVRSASGFLNWVGRQSAMRALIQDPWRRARVEWLQSSWRDDALVGRDGWLFYRHKNPGLLEGREQAHPLAMSRLARALRWKSGILSGSGTAYLFVVAPDKSAVYPDQLPAWIQRGPGSSLAEQLGAELRRAGTFNFIYPRQALVNARAGAQPYYKLDTHWTFSGAAVAAAQAWDALGFPAARRPFTTGRVQRRGDMAIMLGLAHPDESLEDIVAEGELGALMRDWPAGGGGRAGLNGAWGRGLAVDGDSFAAGLAALMARDAAWVDYHRGSPRAITRLKVMKAGAVIDLVTERNLALFSVDGAPEFAEGDDAARIEAFEARLGASAFVELLKVDVEVMPYGLNWLELETDWPLRYRRIPPGRTAWAYLRVKARPALALELECPAGAPAPRASANGRPLELALKFKDDDSSRFSAVLPKAALRRDGVLRVELQGGPFSAIEVVE